MGSHGAAAHLDEVGLDEAADADGVKLEVAEPPAARIDPARAIALQGGGQPRSKERFRGCRPVVSYRGVTRAAATSRAAAPPQTRPQAATRASGIIYSIPRAILHARIASAAPGCHVKAAQQPHVATC